MAKPTFRFTNHASTELTLKAASYSAGGPPSGTDLLPPRIGANSTYETANLGLPLTATYLNRRGTEAKLTLTATPTGDAWQKPLVTISTPPGNAGPAEDTLDFESAEDPQATSFAVNVFDMARVRLTNSSTMDLVLASTNYTPLPKGDAPARVVPPGETREFKLRMWPKAFVNYVLKDTSWTASWLLIWWDESGSATGQIQSPGLQSLDVASETTISSTMLLTHFTVTSRGVSVPVAPSSGRFQMHVPNGNPPLVGISNTRRKVFGVDVSYYNAGPNPSSVDWNKLCGWVDQDQRRVWFAIAKASYGDKEDRNFAAYWRDMSKTRLFRGAYHYPYPPAAGQTAIGAGQAQAKVFIETIRRAGGWRLYDLPPALDLEYGYNPGESLTDERAYGLLIVMTELIRAVSAAFSVAPLLYCNSQYFDGFYRGAKRYYEGQRGAGSWDDDKMSPFVSCFKWIFGQWPQEDVDFSTLKMAAPRGYGGAWDSSWSMWQWGILSGTTTLKVGAPSAANPATTGRAMGLPGDVDVDVWNGDVDSLAALASRSRWNP
jgi:GH25 family lysozyme M1 (1,4-beta-N-acetylmuramidase)